MVRIISMRNFVCLILLFIFFAGIVGCDEPVKKPSDNLTNGIKLSQLIPKHSEKQPTAVNFKIFTFDIPVANYGRFSEAFDVLSKKQMRFSNGKSFRANGFEAGLGNTNSWQTVGNYLKKVGARRAKMSSPGTDFLEIVAYC